MSLALFDLDHTLLAGDSDELWVDYLSQRSAINSKRYRQDYERFRSEYNAGQLDIKEYLAFSLAPLKKVNRKTMLQWRQEFLRSHIIPVITKDARALIASHRARGHKCVIVTITNQFISEIIAAELGVDALFATVPEIINDKYTGQIEGLPCYGEGMILRLEQWMKETNQTYKDSYFYTDSHNDLRLLSKVDHPVPVNPDPILLKVAHENNWSILYLGGNIRKKSAVA